jgi:hypothetical protein
MPIKNKTGEQTAFPADKSDSTSQGMSVRTWLVGQILTGCAGEENLTIQHLTKRAIRIADRALEDLEEINNDQVP